MRIKEMKLHPIAIADALLRSSYGRHAPFALRTIVELISTDGLTGISETYGGDGPLAGLEAARGYIVGSDPFQLTRLFQDVNAGASKSSGDRTQTYLVPGENPLDQASRTFAALEIASLDLIGKAVGKPVCDVIGGRARDEVAFSAYLFYKHASRGCVGDDVPRDDHVDVL